MNTFKKPLAVIACIAITSSFSTYVYASESTEIQSAVVISDVSNTGFSGRVRLGYISINDENEASAQGSAVGAALNYSSGSWHGISAAGSLYATQKLFHDDNSDFFASNGDSYTILGQAYLQANIAATEVKVGRFGFDSPHADMDDIRMVPNTFSGVLVTNTDIADTTVYAAHLTKWSGVDSDKPEKFTDLNDSAGVNVFGIVYQGFDNVALQTWYYKANDLADLFYLEAMVEFDDFSFGAQFGKQSDNSDNHTGPDGDVYGVLASYTLNNFTFSSSYNYVSGTIINGFGGGPFFTSAADHTIEGVLDQNAFAVGVDYSGFENLTIGLLNVAFDKGEDEIDIFVSYYFGNDMAFDFIYHHLHQDGEMVLAMFNMGF
ncbi:outer membrane porin, OprD family [Colwellia sp. BRX10-3]|uniref:OprD family outer membrane porin n=1 Tax=Colwellia sp. BRX10-3 TaxID=2759844 RepID=UPI0015F777AC|nr:OprD family outer membrane porin [Colwellia sp. BRX10-3]MBA6389515.1 outer membrane porin, OprD family [Colwellia sp. BRX10-3]